MEDLEKATRRGSEAVAADRKLAGARLGNCLRVETTEDKGIPKASAV